MIKRTITIASLLLVPASFGAVIYGCFGDDRKAGVYSATAIQITTPAAAASLPKGPDAIGGMGSGAGTDLGDFLLSNSRLRAVIDQPGPDPTTRGGALPLTNVLLPSGGNLVDLATAVSDNDQWNQMGAGVVGVVVVVPAGTGGTTLSAAAGGPALISMGTDHVSAGVRVGDTIAFTGGGTGLNTGRKFKIGLIKSTFGPYDTLGLFVPPGASFDTDSFPNAPVPNGGDITYQITHTTTPLENVIVYDTASIVASSGPTAIVRCVGGITNPIDANDALTIPFGTAVDATTRRLLSGTGGQPITVETDYILFQDTNYLVVETRVTNPNPANPIFLFAIGDIIITGGASRPNLVPWTPLRANYVRGLASPGIVPFTAFRGRDEPGVSYAHVDALTGQEIHAADRNFASINIQLRGAATLPATVGGDDTLTWSRRIIVADGNTVAGAADTAVALLSNSLARENPVGGTTIPNGYQGLTQLKGVVRGAPAGTTITATQVSPALVFDPGTPSGASAAAGFYSSSLLGLNELVINQTGPDPTGTFTMLVPTGFPGQAVPGTTGDLVFPTGLERGTSQVTYRIDVDAPGHNTQSTLVRLPTQQANNLLFDLRGETATLTFHVTDDAATPNPLPCRVMVLGMDPDGAGPTPATPDPHFGGPTPTTTTTARSDSLGVTGASPYTATVGGSRGLGTTDGTTGDLAATVSGVSPSEPIIPGTAVISLLASTFVDNGDGTLAQTGSTGSGTASIDYTSGAVIVTGSDPSAPAKISFSQSTSLPGISREDPIAPGSATITLSTGVSFTDDGDGTTTRTGGTTETATIDYLGGVVTLTNVASGTTATISCTQTLLRNDFRAEQRSEGVETVVDLIDGVGSVQVPPGAYRVLISRGLEYSMARFPPQGANPDFFMAAAGQTVAIDDGSGGPIKLSRVLDQTGLPGGFDSPLRQYVSADFHVHAGGSFDSAVPATDRVASYLTANVEVLVSTEHDNLWDLRPARNELDGRTSLDLSTLIDTQIGVESTGFVGMDAPALTAAGLEFKNTIGHFNAWPLVLDPAKRRNGAPPDEYRTPAELFDGLRGAGATLVQINHPRYPIFPAPLPPLGLGFLTNAKPGAAFTQTRSGGASLRAGGYNTPLRGLQGGDNGLGDMNGDIAPTVPSPTTTDFNDFDVFEVYNNQAALYDAQKLDWYAMTSAGMIRTGTSNSDSHGVTGSLGFPRNFVFTSTTTDDSLDVSGLSATALNAVMAPSLVQGTKGVSSPLSVSGSLPASPPTTPVVGAMDVLCSSGPVVFVEVDGDEDGVFEGRPGSLVSDSATVGTQGQVEVRLTVLAAPWVPVDSVTVIVNGGGLGSFTTGFDGYVVDKSASMEFPGQTYPTDSTTGVVQWFSTLPVNFIRYRGTFTLTLTALATALPPPFPAAPNPSDDWFLVEARGKSADGDPYGLLAPRSTTFDAAPTAIGFSNPIFIDRSDGTAGGSPDGKWDPNGVP